MSPRVIQLPLSGGDRAHYLRELKAAEQAQARLVEQAADAYRIAHLLACREWNTRQFIGGDAAPSPRIADAIAAGCIQLQVKCKRCGHESLVDLTQVIWPRENQVHTLAKVLRCRSCRDERKRPQTDLVALMLPDEPDRPAAPAAAKRRNALK
jgi:phage terminase large subunit GpA-like protein